MHGRGPLALTLVSLIAVGASGLAQSEPGSVLRAPGLPIPRAARDFIAPTVSSLARGEESSTLPEGTFVPLDALTGETSPGSAGTALVMLTPMGNTPAAPAGRSSTPEPMTMLGITAGTTGAGGVAAAVTSGAAVAASAVTRPSGNPITSLQELTARYGVPAEGNPQPGQLEVMGDALAVYPKETLTGLRLIFTGKKDISAASLPGQPAASGSYAALWKDGTVTIFGANTRHQFAHEIAHHLLEKTRRAWGQRVIDRQSELREDFPKPKDFTYGRDNMILAMRFPEGSAQRRLGMSEVSAETVSWFAEGKFIPANDGYANLIREIIKK